MKLHPSITEDRVISEFEADEQGGFCIECGAEAYGVEPDARRYTCHACGAKAVYGAEELLFML